MHLSLLQDLDYGQVVKADPTDEPAFSKVRLISPIKMDITFIFAAHRDLKNPDLMDEWKRPGSWYQQKLLVSYLVEVHQNTMSPLSCWTIVS